MKINANEEELVLLYPHKSMGPDRIHPRVLREGADIIARLKSRGDEGISLMAGRGQMSYLSTSRAQKRA